jgi:hypothetical protein
VPYFFSSCINDKKNDDKAVITSALDFELDETIRSLRKIRFRVDFGKIGTIT